MKIIVLTDEQVQSTITALIGRISGLKALQGASVMRTEHDQNEIIRLRTVVNKLT